MTELPSRPKTDDDLRTFLQEALGIETPTAPLLEDHHAPFDYLRAAFFEDAEPRDLLVWANRGGGKTFYAAVATALDLAFKPGVQIRILAGSLEQAKRMHAHLRDLFDRPALRPLVDGRITERRLRLVNASACELLAQSQTSVRGTRVQKIRCDEVELFDPDVWSAAQLATRSKRCGTDDDPVLVRGSIEALSTMHVPFGLMADLVKNAANRRIFKWGVVDVLGPCGPEHACLPRTPCAALSPEGREHAGNVQEPGSAEQRIGRSDPAASDPQVPDASPSDRSSAALSSAVHSPAAPRSADPSAPCPLWSDCAGRAKRRAEDNPPGHLPVADAIAQKARVSEATWRSEMLCLEPRRSDCVLPEFDPRVHVFTDADDRHAVTPGALWLAGMDFGIRSPTVILWGTRQADVLRIRAERCVAGERLEQHIRALARGPWPCPAWIGADPAGHQTNDQSAASNIELMRKAGLTLRTRPMQLAPSLELLRRRLAPAAGEPTLYIHERCAVLIESLTRYHYPPHDPYSTTPVKDGSDHAVDALRYLIINLDAGYKTTVYHQ